MSFFCRILMIAHFVLMEQSLFATEPSPLLGKRICIDPGHGGTAATDHYRIGIKGEREEWINLRVALQLKQLLENKGAVVIMTRTTDTFVVLASRAETALENKADVFISIHHNATADRSVNFPIIYFHGAASENMAGVELGRHLAMAFKKYFYKTNTAVSLVSDYTVFPEKGAAVLRGTYGIPGLLAEASFFSNEKEERLLKQDAHNLKEASAYLHALEAFFSAPVAPIKEKIIPMHLPPFPVLEEADRMKPEALEWWNSYKKGKRLMHSKDTAVWNDAYNLFTQSARSFPDSFVARDCHNYRAQLLSRMNHHKEAEEERIRTIEFYIKL